MNSADVRAEQAAATAATAARKKAGEPLLKPQQCSRCKDKGIDDFSHSAANHGCPSR